MDSISPTLENFDSLIDLIPVKSYKANILYNLKMMDNEKHIEEYKLSILENLYSSKLGSTILFFPNIHPEINKDIHKRVSYRKHNQVIRKGPQCRGCKNTNTFTYEQQRGGGDEYIPTRAVCYDCGRQFQV